MLLIEKKSTVKLTNVCYFILNNLPVRTNDEILRLIKLANEFYQEINVKREIS
jgi:hypothetical protein